MVVTAVEDRDSDAISTTVPSAWRPRARRNHRASRELGVFVTLSFLVLLTGTVAAHHSFSAEFDARRAFKVTGTVAGIEWSNPHVYVYVAVKEDTSDAMTTWTMELPSPNHLMRHGWTRDALRIGEQVVVEGSQAKDGSRTGNASTIIRSENGSRVFTAPPARVLFADLE
jgi:hypothetical protein